MNDRENKNSSPLQPIVQGSSDETPTVEPGVQGIAALQELLQHVRNRESTLEWKVKTRCRAEFFHGALCEATAMAKMLQEVLEKASTATGQGSQSTTAIP